MPPRPNPHYEPTPGMPTDLITPKAAAKIVKSHVATIHRWLRQGKLKGYRLAGFRFLISEAEVRACLSPVEVEVPVVPRTRAQDIAAADAAVARMRANGARV